MGSAIRFHRPTDQQQRQDDGEHELFLLGQAQHGCQYSRKTPIYNAGISQAFGRAESTPVVVGQASRLPPGRLAPGFVAGETPAKTAGTAAPLLPRPCSWSHDLSRTCICESFHTFRPRQNFTFTTQRSRRWQGCYATTSGHLRRSYESSISGAPRFLVAAGRELLTWRFYIQTAFWNARRRSWMA